MKVISAILRIPGAIWREVASLVDSPGLNGQGSTARSDHGQLSDEGWLKGSTIPDRRSDDQAAERGERRDG
jgi:hypothetical protein